MARIGPHSARFVVFFRARSNSASPWSFAASVFFLPCLHFCAPLGSARKKTSHLFFRIPAPGLSCCPPWPLGFVRVPRVGGCLRPRRFPWLRLPVLSSALVPFCRGRRPSGVPGGAGKDGRISLRCSGGHLIPTPPVASFRRAPPVRVSSPATPFVRPANVRGMALICITPRGPHQVGLVLFSACRPIRNRRLLRRRLYSLRSVIWLVRFPLSVPVRRFFGSLPSVARFFGPPARPLSIISALKLHQPPPPVLSSHLTIHNQNYVDLPRKIMYSHAVCRSSHF